MWRSIIHGRDLLRQDLVWRIGDGSKVNIYHDSWIPRAGCLSPLDATFQPHLIKGASLLNAHGDGWDAAKLEQVFAASDICDIKQVAMGGPCKEDFRAWNFTKTDSFQFVQLIILECQ